jgi:hypothetical protein
MKLIKQLKLTSAIATISLFLFQTQYILAADVTVTTTRTTTITATGTDTITINSGGSLSPTTGVGIISEGSNVTIINRGTILSADNEGIWLNDQTSGADGLTGLIDNYGTITSTLGSGIRLGNPAHVLTTLNNQSGATIQGKNKGVYNLFDRIETLNNFGTIIGNDGRAVADISFNEVSNNGVGVAYITSDLSASQTINNSGIIFGNSKGISLSGFSTGTVTINNSGTIQGGVIGIMNSEFFTNPETMSTSESVGELMVLNNSGTIQGGTFSIYNNKVGNTINLNKGSVIIGTIHSSTDVTLNMNVGASKSYAYTTSGAGTITLNDLNNRPAVKGSAFAINIGSMEMAGENLYQKTANITDAIDRNVKNNKDTWVEPYYSESTRDSGGDSSQIRKFKNNKQGVNAGFKVENSATPLQIIFNVDQTKNNIDSSEHIINSDSVMIGLTAPSYAKYEGFDVSVKGLVGYANSKTDRKILDNTTTTGARTLTGEYDSYYALVGSALSKNYNLDKDLNANLTLGVDLTSEFRDSYSENLYFKYNSLDLVQLQPRIQSEFIKTTGKDSNVFLTAGVGAREILSGKTQKYSMNNTGVSFTAPNSGDYYASLAAGTNMNVAANVNFYTLVSAKMSDRDTETYQASIGLKGTF